MGKEHKRGFLMIGLIIWSVLILVQVGSAMSIQVAPNRFIFRIDQPNTQEVMVTNVSQQPIRIKVYPELVPGQNQDEYLGDWVVVYPRLIQLNPNEKKMIRFTVRAPEKLTAGEYRSLLFFEELPSEELESDALQGMALNIQILTKLGINLYGQQGQLNYRGELQDVQLTLTEEKQLKITGDFVNTGNAHLQTEVKLMILDGEQRIISTSVMPLFVSHRSSVTRFQHQMGLDREGGEYTLKVYFKQNDVMIHEYTRKFEIQSKIR